MTGDQHAARGGFHVAQQRVEQGRLARTGMTDQEHELVRVDLDVDIVQRGLVGLRRVDLGEVLDQDDRFDARLVRGLLALVGAIEISRGEHRGEIGILQGGVDVADLARLIGIGRCAGGARGRHEDVGHAGRRRGCRSRGSGWTPATGCPKMRAHRRETAH